MASFQHLNIRTVLEKIKCFIPSCTLRKAERGTLYETETRYKTNWKLKIAWTIFIPDCHFDESCFGIWLNIIILILLGLFKFR